MNAFQFSKRLRSVTVYTKAMLFNFKEEWMSEKQDSEANVYDATTVRRVEPKGHNQDSPHEIVNYLIPIIEFIASLLKHPFIKLSQLLL